jgi:hypothetical protein
LGNDKRFNAGKLFPNRFRRVATIEIDAITAWFSGVTM